MQSLNQQERLLIPFPKKKYKTIYCDPAWNERGAGKVKRGADNFLKDGLEVMEHWGFKYVTNLAWGKDNDGLKNEFGLGYYFRGQHELSLFGVKGKLKPKVRNESTFILAKKTKHSKKPTRFYEKIERVSHSPMIELFARNTRDGWDSWGDELEY